MQDSLRQQLINKVIETYLKAKVVFNKDFPIPHIQFKDMGRVAGKAFPEENKIIFSPTLFVQKGLTNLSF